MLTAVKACCIAVAVLTSGIVAAAETIKLGLIEPLSGAFAFQGNMSVHVFQMATDEQNAKGGVLAGTKIELVAFDNKGSPRRA